MASRATSGPPSVSEVGHSPDRRVRVSPKPSVVGVLLSATRSERSWHRCLQHSVGPQVSVPFFPNEQQAPLAGAHEIAQVAGGVSHSRSASSPQRHLLLPHPGDADVPSIPVAAISGPTGAGSAQAPKPTKVEFTRIQTLRSVLLDQGFSKDYAQRYIEACADSSTLRYERMWKTFLTWWRGLPTQPVVLDQPAVGEFLIYLHHQGMCAQTIREYLSLLASTSSRN
jgi:hypothetical protein